MAITDPNSGLPEARPEPALFSPTRHLSKKQNLDRKNLINTMRASSPTRDQTSTKQSHHPSALTMFDFIFNTSIGKQIVVFLDYDGTLSPIVDDPDRAFISREMKRAVRDVAKSFPAAIVSGRSRAKVQEFVGLSELYYAGSHGMDIIGPSKRGRMSGKRNQTVLYQPATKFLPMIAEVQRSLVEKIKYIPGAMVENNKFCLSVHYRRVEEERWIELADGVKSVIEEYKQLRLSSGRKVLEIRPVIKWDKGNAIEFLLESLGYAESNDVFPIYIGDDRTDEDAFRVLRNKGEGVGILVSNVHRETNASYTLQEPSEVMQFLKRLVE